MTTLLEMVDFATEFEIACWDAEDERAGGYVPFNEETWKRNEYYMKVAAVVRFGKEACRGDRWRSFGKAMKLRYELQGEHDWRGVAQVIDFVVDQWDGNPNSLFPALRQAFPEFDPVMIGSTLAHLDWHLQERLVDIAYNRLEEGKQLVTTGIDTRADSLHVACSTPNDIDPVTYKGAQALADFFASLGKQGHLVAAYHATQWVEFAKMDNPEIVTG